MKSNTIQLIGPDGNVYDEQPLGKMVENLRKQPTELYPKGLTIHVGGTKYTVERFEYSTEEEILTVYLV